MSNNLTNANKIERITPDSDEWELTTVNDLFTDGGVDGDGERLDLTNARNWLESMPNVADDENKLSAIARVHATVGMSTDLELVEAGLPRTLDAHFFRHYLSQIYEFCFRNVRGHWPGAASRRMDRGS